MSPHLVFFVITSALIFPSDEMKISQTAPVTPELKLIYSNHDEVTIYGSEPHLERDDPILEYCTKGTWLLFSHRNYTAQNDYVLGTGNMDGNCDNWFAGQVYKSARSVGVQSDIYVPSVSLFSDAAWEGIEYLIEYGISNITFPFGSFITIDTRIEFFKEPDYKGDSFCFGLSEDWCEVGTCFIPWLDESYNNPWNPELAKSAKIGCTPQPGVGQHGSKGQNFPTRYFLGQPNKI